MLWIIEGKDVVDLGANAFFFVVRCDDQRHRRRSARHAFNRTSFHPREYFHTQWVSEIDIPQDSRRYPKENRCHERQALGTLCTPALPNRLRKPPSCPLLQLQQDPCARGGCVSIL